MKKDKLRGIKRVKERQKERLTDGNRHKGNEGASLYIQGIGKLSIREAYTN